MRRRAAAILAAGAVGATLGAGPGGTPPALADPVAAAGGESRPAAPQSARPVIVPQSPVAAAGTTLTARAGGWRSGGRGDVAYVWQVEESGSWRDLSAPGRPSFQAPSGLAGRSVRVRIVGGRGGGVRVSRGVRVRPAVAPRDVSVPMVTGPAVVGARLEAAPGVWRGRPRPRLAYQWLRDGVPVAGARDRAYVLTGVDAGSRIAVAVTARNVAGTRTARSTPVEVSRVPAPPAPAPAPAAPPPSPSPAPPPSPPPAPTPPDTSAPAATAPPVIAGAAIEGGLLTASPGTWTGTPAPSLSVAWWSDASGGWQQVGAGTTFTVGDQPAGSAIRVVVTAVNSAGSAQATSAPVTVQAPVAPAVVTPPVVEGQSVVGATLTSLPGAFWGIPAPVVTGYAWQSSPDGGATWAAVAGGDGPTLAIDPALLGATLRLAETVASPAGTATAYSATTTVLPATAPESTSAPDVEGDAVAGGVLSTDGGTWGGAPAPTLSYQWQSSADGVAWTDLAGATGSEVTVGDAEVGLALRVVVTATNDAGTASAASGATTTVPAVPPASVTPPSISGRDFVGVVLTASPGTWTGTPAPSLVYRWLHSTPSGDWLFVPGGVGTRLRAIYPAGTELAVTVTATNRGGSAMATSPRFGPLVGPGPPMAASAVAPAP